MDSKCRGLADTWNPLPAKWHRCLPTPQLVLSLTPQRPPPKKHSRAHTRTRFCDTAPKLEKPGGGPCSVPLAPLRSWGVLTGHQASRLLCTCALITPRRHSAPSPPAAPLPFPRESSQSGPPCRAGRPRAAKAVAPLAPASARPPPPGSCRQHMRPPQSLRSHKLSSALRACFSSLCPCPSLPTSQKLTRCQRGRPLPGPRAHPH